ncbi:hypothetical protein Droror1_Dr00027990, partial [Drosera rotundifolia]
MAGLACLFVELVCDYMSDGNPVFSFARKYRSKQVTNELVDEGSNCSRSRSSALTASHAVAYHAPEVTDLHKVSHKADVYSFGILLLELLTGRNPAQAIINGEGIDLLTWVRSIIKEEDFTSDVFDLELLRSKHAAEEMDQLLLLAIDCTSQYPDRRPSMLK